jgi:hypothetical protein
LYICFFTRDEQKRVSGGNRAAQLEERLLKEKFEEEYLGELKVNKNWRNRYNEELMQLFGDLDIECVGWIGYVNRMNGKRKE